MGLISKCGSTLAVCLMLLGATATHAGTIFGSKHDLSLGAGQVCGYCHAPHNASTQAGLAEAPLWNRRISNLDAFTPYTSPSMTETCPTRPSGVSLACLNCHDGASSTDASAVHTTTTTQDQHDRINPGVSGGGTILNCSRCHNTVPAEGIYSKALTKMAGPDLSNDHPISMQYPLANTNFVTPPDAGKGWGDVKLFNGKVECPTCHAVHDPTNVPFLRASNSGSSLCLRCHNK